MHGNFQETGRNTESSQSWTMQALSLEKDRVLPHPQPPGPQAVLRSVHDTTAHNNIWVFLDQGGSDVQPICSPPEKINSVSRNYAS